MCDFFVVVIAVAVVVYQIGAVRLFNSSVCACVCITCACVLVCVCLYLQCCWSCGSIICTCIGVLSSPWIHLVLKLHIVCIPIMYTYKSKAVRLKEAILGIRCCCFLYNHFFFFLSFSHSLLHSIFSAFLCVCVWSEWRKEEFKKKQQTDLYFYFEKGVNIFNTVVLVPLCIYVCKTVYFFFNVSSVW